MIAVAASTERVRIDEQSRAVDLRLDTQRRAYQSLAFFVTNVARVPVPVELVEDLQELGLRRLVLLLAAATVWTRLHKCKTPSAITEAVRWIFPETKDF